MTDISLDGLQNLLADIKKPPETRFVIISAKEYNKAPEEFERMARRRGCKIQVVDKIPDLPK